MLLQRVWAGSFRCGPGPSGVGRVLQVWAGSFRCGPDPSGVGRVFRPGAHAAVRHLIGIRLARRLLEVQMPKRDSSKRELIDTGRNKMYAKRDVQGRFREMDDVSRSLSADRR